MGAVATTAITTITTIIAVAIHILTFTHAAIALAAPRAAMAGIRMRARSTISWDLVSGAVSIIERLRAHNFAFPERYLGRLCNLALGLRHFAGCNAKARKVTVKKSQDIRLLPGMTFIYRSATNEAIRPQAAKSSTISVRLWLCLIAACVFAMVMVGGATRLTGSGLSITEWQPILGAFPPTTESDWLDAFQKYQQIPEYQLINKGMSLGEFKAIYWWEWSHRLLGRLIGFVFFLPFVYFLWRREIPKPFISRVGLLFVLGGAQGLLGWLMVKSGLTERVDVSQYRLAAHLGLAVLIAGYALWLALSLNDKTEDGLNRKINAPSSLASLIQFCAGALAIAIYIQIVLGGFVAGLKAGHVSDTWPLMNGAFVPPGLDALSPWYANIFENPLTAQFSHRMVAYAIALLAAFSAIAVWKGNASPSTRISMAAICISILIQIALGVATIVYAVPLGLALAHQANAIVLFALALWHLHNSIAPRAYVAARA